MKPRITLIANYAPDEQESMSRFAEMVRSVMAGRGFEVAVIRPDHRAGRLRRLIPFCEKWLGYVDKYIFFPFDLRRHARRLPTDRQHVYHITDHSNAVYSFALRDQPRVVTCHDALAIRSALGEIPENPTSWTGRILQGAILAGLKHIPHLVCVSENTGHELRRLIGPDKGDITTVLQPLNYDFRPVPQEEAMRVISALGEEAVRAVEKGCILHLGGNQWYKNREGVFRIYMEMERKRRVAEKEVPPLILAGKKPDAELDRLVAEAKDLPIVVVTSPSNEQVRALYSMAKVFLFPSLQEGLGWPIVEAMACGCLVVTTGRAPMTEAGGNCATYIDPTKPCLAAVELERVLDLPEAQRNELALKARLHASNFTNESFGDHYANAYQRALATQGQTISPREKVSLIGS
jgi:glycosyltransferase involved in cell wall biosynthesis